MKKIVFVLILFFYWNSSIGQFTWTDNSGNVDYHSLLPKSHMHFFIFDDGYYRKQMHPKHFYTAGLHNTTLYEIDNKQSDDPFEHSKAVSINPHSTPPPNPHLPLRINGSVEAKPSWNITQDYYGMLLFEFENDFSGTTSSGCLELKYDPNLLTVNVNPDPRNWANLQSHQNGVISWTYNNLKPDEQRVLYLDTNAKVAGRKNYKLSATISDNCTSPITTVSQYRTDKVPHDPNSKVVTNTDYLAETWPLNIPMQFVPQEVVYRITFHNDGENFAQDVSIFDNIHPKADPSSIQFVNSSHPCTFNVNWNLLEIEFDNIYLPGAAQTDPDHYSYDETIGFFEYSICIPQRIDPNELLETQAQIYFDAIGPVIAENEISAHDTQAHENFCGSSNNHSFTNTSDLEQSFISIFPIPANEYLFVKGLNQNSVLNIYDRSGRLMIFEKSQSSDLVQLNINHLNSGFYILEIRDSDTTRFEKFIKH